MKKKWMTNSIFLFLVLVCVISFIIYLSSEKKLSSDELKAQLCKYESWVEVTNRSCPDVYSFSEDGTMEMRGQMTPEYQHYKWNFEGNALKLTNTTNNDVIKTTLTMYKKNNKYFLTKVVDTYHIS